MSYSDDPSADYDRYCAEQTEYEDPDCEHCGGFGCTIGSWPMGGVDCKECGGTGYERDAVKRRELEREAAANVAWAEAMAPLFDSKP